MKHLSERSIKTKLIMIIFGIAFASQVIVFGVLTVERHSYLKNELNTKSRVLAKLVAEYSISPLMFDDIEGVKNILQKIDVLPFIYAAAVYNESGNLVISYITNPEIINIPEKEEYNAYESSHLFHVVEPIVYQGVNYGSIHLQVSKAGIIKDLITQLLFFLALVVAMAILILIAARKMQQYISGPILHLAETAKNLTKDEKYPVELKNGSNDEIGLLFESFSNMVEKVNNRRDERDEALEKIQEQYERFLAILNAFPESIYIVDPKTYKILFANSTLESRVGRDLVGGKCYNILYGYDEVCSFCKLNMIIKLGDDVTWERYFKIIGKHFMITDKMIKWPDGRDVCMAVAIDISERKENEKELKKHREHLEVLVKERTSELETQNIELERFNKLFIGREFRIKELREKVKKLQKEDRINDID